MEKIIKIGNVEIGENKPTVIIAEIACEHGGSMENAKKLISAAKEAGADAAKFQLHLPEFEMVPGVINFWAGSLDEVLSKVNIGKKEQHQELMAYCKEIGIQYLCTPFCIEAADILEEIDVDAFKTGSGEMTNLPMIRHIAKKNKPMIVSTGMATIEEIEETVNVLDEERANFMLMNCTSEYPPKYSHLNLNFINELKQKYGILVGHSDHTKDIYSAIAAAVLGANVIEKHFTIPGLNGPDDIVSLSPEKFREMVTAVRMVEQSMCSKKYVTEEEKKVRDWAHHSIVVKNDIKGGDLLKPENLKVCRPGTGIPAKFFDKKYNSVLFSLRAKNHLEKNRILQWDDIGR